MDLTNEKKSNYAYALVIPFVASFVVSFYSYFIGAGIFNPYEAVASLLFWLPLLFALFIYPLRYIVSLFTRYIRTVWGTLIFAIYLTVHLLLYGLILEGILLYIYKVPPIINQAAFSFSAILAYPQSFVTTLEDFAFNPALNVAIPPGYALGLTLYSFVVAIIVAVLVVTNVMKVRELSKDCSFGQKSRVFVALPALGVVGGATCCLSVPFLLSLFAPVTAIVSGSLAAYYVAYLAFPAATVVALKYNLDSTMRIASKLSVRAAEV